MSVSLPANWPNRAFSRFVTAAGLDWHVQVMGKGPVLLLAHGTGAATHSWRDLAPLLAHHFTVVAPDLPGHGFTEAPASSRMALPSLAKALHALLSAMEVQPAIAVGHSAGAAILVRMCLDGQIAPRALIGLNGALMPLGGFAGQMFSPLARLMTGMPFLPQLFAWRAQDRSMVQQMLAGTGSEIGAEGVELYASMLQDSGRAAAVLDMMAHWDVANWDADLPRLTIPLLLVVGDNDRTVPPDQSAAVARRVSGAKVERMAGLGHLAHEEDPAGTAALILGFARDTGILPA